MAPEQAARRLHGERRSLWVLAVLIGFGAVFAYFLAGQGGLGGSFVAEIALVGLASSVAGVVAVGFSGLMLSERAELDQVQVEAAVERLAETVEARILLAEEEASTALTEVRHEAMAAIEALRSRIHDQQDAFHQYVSTHRSVHRLLDDAFAFEKGELERMVHGRTDVERRVDAMRTWEDADVVSLEAVAPEHARRLHAIGIATVGDLYEADAMTLARSLRVWPNLVRQWQAEARMSVPGRHERHTETGHAHAHVEA